jgi:CrcB protein
MWKNILLVAFGGGVGSALRYLTSVWIGRAWPQASFPWATLTANVLGCFLIGFLMAKWPGSGPWKLLLVTGFCGGYTTFSTFALENHTLVGQAMSGTALLYLLASVMLGWLAVWAGNAVG